MSWVQNQHYWPWVLLLGVLRLQAQTAPPTEMLRGKLGVYIEDRFAQHFTATHYSLQTSTGHIELIFTSSQDVRGLTSGSDIEVTGHRQGSRFVVADDAAATTNAEGSRARVKVLSRATLTPRDTAIGQRKIAIILINFANQTTQPLTMDQARVLFEASNQYYEEASYQQFSLSADFYGYLTLDINNPCLLGSDASIGALESLADTGVQVATGAGIDLSPYHDYVFIGPTPTNCAGELAGYASIGGNPGLVRLALNAFDIGWAPILSHEIGHNLGLYHSHAYGCNTVIYDPNADCGYIEYGDDFDVMANATLGVSPHFNASYKALLGWLSPTDVLGSGIYNISPTEISGGTPALNIAPPGASDSFYLEFRQPLGFDSSLQPGVYNNMLVYPPEVYQGALFHLAGNPAFVLNMHLAPKPLIDPTAPALLPGEKYTDYANRFSVTAVSTSPAAVQVRVLMPGVTSPTLLFVAPADSAIVTGVATVSVDALDRGSIAKVELYLGGTLIGTQTQVLNQAGTAGPAQYYTFSWDTTGVASGSHTLTATVFNALNVSAIADIAVTVRKPPVVAISSPSNQTSLTDVSSIMLVAGVTTDHAAVQSVQFFADGNSLGFGSANASGGYSFTWSNVPAGTFVVTATATDANGLVSTSAPITITVHNPVVSTGGVVNGASLANGQAVTPGALVSIFGSDLAPSGVGAGSIPLPDEISGVSVTMNGVTAPLAYVSTKQINAQVPWELSNVSGTVPLVVTRDGVSSPPQNVQVSSASPAMFTLQSGIGQAVAINPDGSFAAPENSIPGTAAHPAKPGDTITIYATGLGEVTPTALDGNDSSDELRKTVTTPTVLVGSVAGKVLFSGLSPQFVGVNQLNVTIAPGTPAGDAVTLQIQMGGVMSSDKVTIAVDAQ